LVINVQFLWICKEILAIRRHELAPEASYIIEASLKKQDATPAGVASLINIRIFIYHEKLKGLEAKRKTGNKGFSYLL